MQINFSIDSILTPTLGKDNVVIHLLLGYFFPAIFDVIGMNHGHPHLWIVGLVIDLTFTPYKEFYYDPHHETKEISGGWKGDVCDFLEYMIGMGLFLLTKFA